TVKYCSSDIVLVNTVKDILNKDLSTPLIYIGSTVYKMAKILTQKYLLQSFFHITLVHTVRSQNDRFQDTVKRSNLFCSEYSPPATSVGQCVPQQGLGRRQGRGHSRTRGAPVWHS